MNERATSKDFVRRTSGLTAQIVLTRLLSIIYVFWVAKWLSAGQRTELASLLMFLSITTTIILLSLPAYLSVNVPMSFGDGRVDKVRGDFEFVYWVNFATSITTTIISLFIMFQILAFLFLTPTLNVVVMFWLVVVTLVPYTLLNVTNKMLLGLNRIEKLTKVNAVNAFITYGVALVLIFPVPGLNLGPLGVVVAWLLAAFVSFVLSLYYLRDTSKFPRLGRHTFMEIFRFSAPLWVSAIFMAVNPWIDKYLVLATLGDALGNYYYAVRIVQIAVVILGAIATTFLPVIAKARGEGIERTKRVFDVTLTFTIYIAGIITVSMIVFAGTILVAILGVDFLSSLTAFQILSITVFTQTIVGLLAGLFVANKRTIVILVAAIVQFIVTLTFGIILIPYFAVIDLTMGLAAAAFVSVLGYLANFLVYYIFLRRETVLRIRGKILGITMISAGIAGIFMYAVSISTFISLHTFIDQTVGNLFCSLFPVLAPFRFVIVSGVFLLVQLGIFLIGLLIYGFLIIIFKGFQPSAYDLIRKSLHTRLTIFVNWAEAIDSRIHKREIVDGSK